MHLNWVDYASMAFVALVGAIQFLRATRDFSRVLYETIFLIGAVVLAVKLFQPVHDLVHLSYALSFLLLSLLGVLLAIVLAALVNTRLAFGFGAFSYVFGLLLAIGCAYSLGHVAIRTPFIAFGHLNPAFYDAVRRSWMARDLLYFRTFVEVLAILRVARWLNM